MINLVTSIHRYLENIDVSLLIIIEIIGILFLLIILLFRRISKQRRNMLKLNRLVKYNKKRREIEEAISMLSRQLVQSDIGNYLDINNLIFTGQLVNTDHKWGDYNIFLKEFGLDKDTIKVRENSAAFLTPFDEYGYNLYEVCQHALLRMGIFLQKTDNYVSKGDVLMNIISLIVQSEVVIANIDGRNPNVYYELGIAHALGKPTVLLSRKIRGRWNEKDIGFDLRQKRIVIYDSMEDLEKKLPPQIHMVLNKE